MVERLFHSNSSGKEMIIRELNSDVFERRTSTGSEPFPLLISLDPIVFLLPSVLILIETICLKVFSKSQLKCAKSPLPVDVRRSKTSLLKLLTSGKRRPFSQIKHKKSKNTHELYSS